MKRFHWFEARQNWKEAGRIRIDGGLIGALAGSLIVSSLFVVGCSEEQSKTSSSNNQLPVTQSSSNLNIPVNTAAATPSVLASKAKPKKVTRKRPAVVTYADQSYGLSFQYPRKYTLKSGEKSNDLGDSQVVAMDFAQPGGVTVAGVELPKGSYPGTDLKAAFFNVSVNKGVKAEECEQFALPESSDGEKSGAKPDKLSLAGMNLREVEDITREDANWADAKYYHAYQNGGCYEFALGLTTQGGGTDDGPAPVDREDVFRQLEKILATVKIKQDVATVNAPAVAEVPVVNPVPAAAAPVATADPAVATTAVAATSSTTEGGQTTAEQAVPETAAAPVATSNQQVSASPDEAVK